MHIEYDISFELGHSSTVAAKTAASRRHRRSLLCRMAKSFLQVSLNTLQKAHGVRSSEQNNSQ